MQRFYHRSCPGLDHGVVNDGILAFSFGKWMSASTSRDLLTMLDSAAQKGYEKPFNWYA